MSDGPSSTISLSGGSLRSYFVLASHRGEAALTQKADYLTHLSFNGDDTIVMTAYGQVLDVFSQVGLGLDSFGKMETFAAKI